MKKQIIIDYQEYLETEEKLKKLIFILSKIYFKEKVSENIKNEIQEANRIYGWWV